MVEQATAPKETELDSYDLQYTVLNGGVLNGKRVKLIKSVASTIADCRVERVHVDAIVISRSTIDRILLETFTTNYLSINSQEKSSSSDVSIRLPHFRSCYFGDETLVSSVINTDVEYGIIYSCYFENINFENFNVIGTAFINCIFDNCTFLDSMFYDSSFSGCSFIDCENNSNTVLCTDCTFNNKLSLGAMTGRCSQYAPNVYESYLKVAPMCNYVVGDPIAFMHNRTTDASAIVHTKDRELATKKLFALLPTTGTVGYAPTVPNSTYTKPYVSTVKIDKNQKRCHMFTSADI